MKDILLNLLFIVVIFLITIFFGNSRKNAFNREKGALIIYGSSLISILFCMSFSIIVTESYQYDLRAIPLILGGLLGGPIVSVCLYVSMVLYRLLLGFEFGLWSDVLNYGLITIALLVGSRNFIKYGAKKRVIISFILFVFHIVLSYIVYTIIFVSHLPLSIFLQACLIQIVTSTLIVIFAEVVLLHNKNQEEAEETKMMELVTHLSASIAHEIRNGITGAQGFIQLLKENEANPKKEEYIEFALDELTRTENIIRDFLTFAKPIPKQIRVIQLDQLISSSVSLIAPLAKMNSIEIQQNLAPCKIKCDERMIQQSFINFFKNGIEAMPYGGLLKINMICNHDRINIAIIDNGVGMSQEQMNRIGTPYYTTKGYDGTGLGMMVAYRVIRELNGEVNVCSQIGEGTTFTINLPNLFAQEQ